MRAFVFTDKALTRHAGRFVWLSLDTENAKNAPDRERLAVKALPTFFVVDPADEHVAIRWVGSGNVEQMARLFDDGVIAVKGGKASDAAMQALVLADRKNGEEKYEEAIPAYRDALARARPGWPGIPRTVESLLSAYARAEKPEETVKLATEWWPKLKGQPSGASVAASGLDAALELPETRPGRAELVAAFEAHVRSVLDDRALALSGDDRSGLYFSLEGARDAAKDEPGLRALREQHLAMLDREAAAARSPEQRTVFDAHRLTLNLALETPEKAIPFLTESERDFPDDYNPPARLALAYKAMKRWPEAIAASDRALARVYGPRQLVVLQARADILAGSGDKPAARKTLADAVTRAEAMPAGQRSERTIAAIKKKLEGLGD